MAALLRHPTLLAILAGGLLARLGVAALSHGSNDIDIWQQIAQIVASEGLFGRYGDISIGPHVLNHPPLPIYYAVFADAVAQTLGLRFSWLFKLPVILGEIAIAGWLALLLGSRDRPQLSLAIAYASSPLAILISAHHGNNDAL